MTSRIVVVGLGPGGTEHVTDQTRAAIAAASHRYLRTAQHPSAGLVRGATTFDHVYDAADTFDDVYVTIVNQLIAAAGEHGEILYAVPGSPLVLERTVRELLKHAIDDDTLDVDVLPAMSFLDVAWARLRIDPVEAGIRLVDGHDFAPAAAGERGPLLVAHTHANWVLSEIKLAVDDSIDADESAPVVILHALGTPDERIVETTWAQLDQTIEADHLTSIYIPELTAPVGQEYVRFHQLARTLREQCPWDIEQTHQSLIPHLLEETYELVDALQALDPDAPATEEHLIEELGDLLYQVEFHATIAEQEGRFTIADVARGIHDKLVRRHPHVFDQVEVDGTDEVLSNWDDIKQAEKGRTSIFEGIPHAMPSLAYARKVGSKASKVGFDWPDVEGAFVKIPEETDEVAQAMSGGDVDELNHELGDLLFAVVNVARHLDIDPELALRTATDRFRSRFEIVERLARERSIVLESADLATLDDLWNQAKLIS